MQRRTTEPFGVTRRGFMVGTAAAAFVIGTRSRVFAKGADFQWKLGLSQPLTSPNYIRLKEMAENIGRETNGALQIDVHGGGALGNDSKMVKMVMSGELELYNAGNVLGPIAPVYEIPGLPFVFDSPEAVFKALDGELGQHIHQVLLTKGIHSFPYWLDNGFHDITSGHKPLRNVEDMQGMNIRTPVQKMTVDFFKTIGCNPKVFTLNKVYQVLKDKVCDGMTDPPGLILLLKLDEVQKYVNITNHWWSGFTFTASTKAWDQLPQDLQAVVDRNAKQMAMAQRQDLAALNANALRDLEKKGMTLVDCDTSGFKSKLGEFYKRWKAVYGDEAWTILEKYTGKLV